MPSQENHENAVPNASAGSRPASGADRFDFDQLSGERSSGERLSNRADARFSADMEGLFATENDTSFLACEPLLARMAAGIGRHHALLMALCVVLLWMVVGLPSLRPQNEYRKGDVVAHDIVAPHTALIADQEETNARRREAVALVPPVYDGNPSAQEQALAQFDRLLAKGEYSSKLPAASRKRVARAGANAVRAVYRGGQIRSDVAGDIKLAQARIASSLDTAANTMYLSASEYSLALELAQKVARIPNLVVDEKATALARRDAQNAVRPVFGRVEAGDVVVKAGQSLDDQKWASLVELGLVAPRFELPIALARLALCAVLVLFAGCYFATLDRATLSRPSALWLTAMVPIGFLLVFRLLLRIPHADLLIVPIAAAAAILLTILLQARLGLLIGFLVATLGTVMAHGDAGLLLTANLVAWCGALSTFNITSRGQLVRAGLLVGIAGAGLTAIMHLLRDRALDPATLERLFSLLMWSFGAGVLAVILAVALAMLLERPLGITTHLRLMELLAPDEAVLRRLQTEAPGTYTHSLMVSLLSEAAAKATDADSLLCRVGGLYHDIGKLRRPHCFVENQSGENIHDRLSPTISARLIVAHVADGLALGNALKLPRPVLDIIATHHGTSRVEYFYRQALSQNELLDKSFQESQPFTRQTHDRQTHGAHPLAMHSVDEEDFRYPGPRPQNKEAAIVLLADAIEASSRALASPTVEKLEHHVQTMLGARLREGELSDCDLTLRDLGKIETAFLHVLKGALHHRITYPSNEKSDDLSTFHYAQQQHAQQHDVLCMQKALAESFLGNGSDSEKTQSETVQSQSETAQAETAQVENIKPENLKSETAPTNGRRADSPKARQEQKRYGNKASRPERRVAGR